MQTQQANPKLPGQIRLPVWSGWSRPCADVGEVQDPVRASERRPVVGDHDHGGTGRVGVPHKRLHRVIIGDRVPGTNMK
jgi:hypothetical protein